MGCPACGHIDHLGWLPEERRLSILEEAERRRPMIHERMGDA